MAAAVRQHRMPEDPGQAPALSKPDTLVVTVPTQTLPSHLQRVIGRKSAIPGIEEFRGIPYGIVPARWQHAVLRDRLPRDVFDATQNGPRCPQPQEPNNSDEFQSYLEFPGDVKESEFDCLNLFITRPSAAALAAAGFDAQSVKLPVYVYIHGGAYSFGAGTDPMWDPARLVKRSVAMKTPMIVATINYRLNMFGFAGSSEIIQVQPEGQPKGCNFGLSDQRTAIIWVRQNIGAFGGDATRITVGGQSAGGSSSHVHALEAILTKGEPLVQRAIIQSGALGVLGPIPMAVADARWEAFCRHLGAPTGDASSRIAFMATVAPADILRAAHQLGSIVCPLVVDDLTISQKPNGRWGIHFGGNEAISSGNAPSQDAGVIPVLIGDTDVEGVIHLGEVGKIRDLQDLKERLAGQVTSTEFLDGVYQAYGLQPDVPVSDLRIGVLQLLTDIQFGYPVQCARQELMGWEGSRNKDLESRARPTVVHSYRMSVGNPFPGPRYGLAQHCVDLIYIYDCFADALRIADNSLPAEAVANAALVERIQEDWVRFITAPSVSSQAGCATVYGSDRTASSIRMESDQVWTDRLRRFHLLERYWLSAQQAIKALAGTGHVF
ncbi:carboxylesterase [Aspergillus sclerotiicarbonarius CBS 121057]|uniref:Carboxylic ester hydrolase n=1 Tax=Aspergillus sclerotiicarbonarius (strain CBS 121057 / IBT 28362) TaxID=1448318 RepID=A0A319ENW4_ASPSB|nr:carboxylesterase [Aspergillus sclerotiicarbonarius CBS 121057]